MLDPSNIVKSDKILNQQNGCFESSTKDWGSRKTGRSKHFCIHDFSCPLYLCWFDLTYLELTHPDLSLPDLTCPSFSHLSLSELTRPPDLTWPGLSYPFLTCIYLSRHGLTISELTHPDWSSPKLTWRSFSYLSLSDLTRLGMPRPNLSLLFQNWHNKLHPWPNLTKSDLAPSRHRTDILQTPQ